VAHGQWSRRLVRLLINRVVVQPNLNFDIDHVLAGRGRLAADR